MPLPSPARILLSILLGLGLLAGQARADEVDWNLRIKKEQNGWSASFTSSQDYGSGSPRIKGSGHRVEKVRSVAAFSKLRLEGSLDVRLSQAASDSVKVSAEDNIEPLIETRVDGDTLVVRVQKDASFRTRLAPTVLVESKSLQQITVDGSGDLQLDRFKGERLSLSLQGSGDVRVGLLEVKELNASLNGSGDVQVAGRADNQVWSLNGSGDVDARALSGRSVKAELSGSGDLALGVSESLDANLRGSGDLSYAGRPQLRQSISGSGEISRR
ncbi:MAG: hypothetical protein CFE41_15080 [Burkholderiales bacterium PBB2]|nr:MAG: hypothetical protein CFE41_15080 [Burkholderiales bacterium PBB2]